MVDNNQSIIIKRVKKVAGGHHGGAWKVAYADFVTAMMAFFLLLWLLNATEAENLAGLADYFAPTIGVKDEMGIGFRGGKNALSEGIGADKNTNKGVVFGGVPTGPITKVTTKIEERTDQEAQEKMQVVINDVSTDKKGSDDNEDNQSQPVVSPQAEQKAEDKAADEELEKTQQAIQSTVQDMVKDRRIDEGAIEIKRTPEGLMIEIKDLSGNSMFENDTSKMKDKLKTSLVELTKILKNLSNTFAVIGHTSSEPIKTKVAGYTKWELSADRANATRNFLTNNGIEGEQFSRIEGRADNVPYDTRRPESSVNNRINIIILSKNDTPEHKKTAPNSILIDTRSNEMKKYLEDVEPKKKEEEKKTDPAAPTPIKEDIDVKGIMKTTVEDKNEIKKIDPNATPAPAADVIDLKIDKKEKAPKVDVVPKGGNAGFQNILKDSDKASELSPEEAAKAKAQLKSADVIDLTKTEKKETPKVDAAPKADNSGFQNILKESDKAATISPEEAAKAKATLTNSDVIDFSKEEKTVVPKVDAAPKADNSGFQNILKESEKIKDVKPANAEKKNLTNSDVIDLKIDKTKVEKKVDDKKKEENSLFQDILNESAKTAKEAAEAAKKNNQLNGR